MRCMMKKILLIVSIVVLTLFLVACSQQGSERSSIAGQARNNGVPQNECQGKADKFLLRDCGVGINTKKTCASGVVKEEACPCANEKDGKSVKQCSNANRVSETCDKGKVVTRNCPAQQQAQAREQPPAQAQQAPAAQAINACGIYGPGNFALSGNIVNNGVDRDCIALRTDTTLDCRSLSVSQEPNITGQGAGISISGTPQARARNINVLNCNTADYEFGVNINNADHITIQGSTFVRSATDGIRVLNSQNVIVDGNTVSNSGRYGINFQGDQLSVGNIIRNNRACVNGFNNIGPDVLCLGNMRLSGTGNHFNRVTNCRGLPWPVLNNDYVTC